MDGLIAQREVLRNAALIAREFGFGCLVRCLWACIDGRKTTFLEIAFKK